MPDGSKRLLSNDQNGLPEMRFCDLAKVPWLSSAAFTRPLE